MKRERFTEEQIITILKENEAGSTVVDLACHHGVAENTIYRWKSKYGSMEVPDAKRRKKLIRLRVPLDLPGRAGERWSIDFCARPTVLRTAISRSERGR